MDDPAKVIVAVVFFTSVAYSIKAIAQAAVAHRREESRARDSSPAVSEARLARIEQAVEAIALEVERISEGQRFTTKLLSEQARPAPKPVQRQLSTNTPT
ncbi:MAG TPA: hypothetical protein VNG73_07230 [Gemmatimonadaceae bacterium]|jgi:hypothetical protein|nr:hypothetical protein [Gemmatimonadaceae bacterium]